MIRYEITGHGKREKGWEVEVAGEEQTHASRHYLSKHAGVGKSSLAMDASRLMRTQALSATTAFRSECRRAGELCLRYICILF